MKTTLKILLILLTVGFVGCQNEESFGCIESETSDMETAEDIIQQLGLHANCPIGHYEENSILRQAHTTNLVSPENVKNIKVFLGLPEIWWIPAKNALEWWNQVPGSAVRFTITTKSFEADILFEENYAGSGIAMSEFPSNGKPGKNIRINRDYRSLDIRMKNYVMVHELGHALGLRHTDWNRSGEGETDINGNRTENGIQIPGTSGNATGGDPQSVMNAQAGFWEGFSPNDIKAIQYLYPIISIKHDATIYTDLASYGVTISNGENVPTNYISRDTHILLININGGQGAISPYEGLKITWTISRGTLFSSYSTYQARFYLDGIGSGIDITYTATDEYGKIVHSGIYRIGYK